MASAVISPPSDPAAVDPEPSEPSAADRSLAELHAIVRRVLAGETEAFAEIVRRFQGKVFSMALFYTRNPTAAEDLAQEVFLATYQSLPRFDLTRSFTNWILRIATNHCLKSLRRKTPPLRPDDLSSPFVDPEEETLTKERQALVLEALHHLNDDFRLVIWLHYFFDRKCTQIAEILEIPLSLVKVRLFRGRKAVEEFLASHPSGREIGGSTQENRKV